MDIARIEAEEFARQEAERLGHQLGPFTLIDGTVLYKATCLQCRAVVKFYPFIPTITKGNAVRRRCKR